MSEEKFSVIRQYEKGTKRRRTWKKVVGVLACAVVFCTVYALILPAVAVDYKCGMEEHSHSPACYRQLDTGSNRRLTCTPGSLGIHSHDGSCYDGEGNLICGYADYVLHTHDASCYDDQGNLVCPFPEIAEDWDPETGEGAALHTHTSDCYDENGQLVCGRLETYEHTHGSHCFTEEQPPLTCTIPEGEGHTHTAVCYGDWELVCGLPEHTHTADCCKIPESTEPSVTENATVPPETTEPSATEDATVPTDTTEPSATEDATVPPDTTEPSATEDATVPPDATEPAVTEDATVPTDTTEPSVAGDPTEPTDDRVLSTLPDGPIAVDSFISDALLKYKGPNDPQWQDITQAAMPGNVQLGLKVTYEKVPLHELQGHGGQLYFDLPELFQNPVAEGEIKDTNQEKIGTVTVSGNRLLMQFDETWLRQQADNNSTEVQGSFRLESAVNIAQIPDGGQKEIVIGKIVLKPTFETDLLAKYGDVTVKKASALGVAREDGKDYLEYTLTLTAGPNGCLDVKVEDQFTANGSVAAYDGVSNVSTPLTDAQETIPAGKNHGSISMDAQSGSLVWVVGNMDPNEVRTLTYRVQLLEGYTYLQNGNEKVIQNEATAYSGQEKKNSSSANFAPKAGLDMKKSHEAARQDPTDGSYIIDYQVWIEAYGDNNFTLENVRIEDSLHHEKNPTNADALQYISYVEGSFQLYQTKNASGPEVPLVSTGDQIPRVEYGTDGKSFTLYVGDVQPGGVYRLQYQVRVDLKAFAAVSQESLEVCNRAIAYADNAKKNGMDGALQAYNTKSKLDYDHWVQKTAGNRITQALEVAVSGQCYDATVTPIVQESQPLQSFNVPAGSYQYAVTVNDRGDWDVKDAIIKDQLHNEHMQYVGYVQVNAYTPKGPEHRVSTEPVETRWVKVDKLSQFQFTMAQIGLTDPAYAYQLTYYGAPVNMGSVSQVPVTNGFTISGQVGIGGDKITLAGVTTEVSVILQGDHSFEAKKNAWYYEGAQGTTGPWTNGTLYWVIESNGTEIPADVILQDQLKNESQMTFYEDSLVGVYTGSFPDGKSFTSYENLAAVLDSGCLTEIPASDYTVSYGNLNHELTVQMNSAVPLEAEQSLYIVVKAEPTVLPAGNRDYKTYTNYLRSSDDGKNWVDRGQASKTLYGGENILKELGSVFTYDGTEIKRVGTSGRGGEVPKQALKGPGTYVAWAVKVNYAGKLAGRYRVVDTIPDGMEVAFARLKWRGDKLQGKDTGMCQISTPGSGWTERQVMANTDRGRLVTSYYYTNGNQILWEVNPLIAGNERDTYSVDVQVVCRVTDPDVLLGGQTGHFNNQVVLLSDQGTQVGSDANGVDVQVPTMEKTAVLTGSSIPFTVTVNPLGEDLVLDSDTIVFMDEMSPTLRLDPRTIRVVDANLDLVKVTSSIEGNTLSIVIPDDQRLTISYTADVVAAPGEVVAISNHAYWKGYENSGGSSVEKTDYSYDVDATAGGNTTPTITVYKNDQYDLMQSLPGAEFELQAGTLGNGIFTPQGTPQQKKTDQNGMVKFGEKPDLLAYNTVYRIVETKAPEGYVLDSTPRYVMVAKRLDNGNYPEYPEEAQVHYDSSDFTLNVPNRKGEAYVEKKFQDINGKPVTQIKGTYRFGLYDKPEATGKPLQTVELVFDGTTQAPRGTFVNLDLGRPYYIYELDDAGNPITGTNQAMVDSRPFAVTYSSSAQNSSQVQANGTVTVTNRLLTESLPMTGGPGTFLYTAAGLMLLCGGAWLWYRKVRNGREMC